jgi:hypothetical protein
MRVCDRCGRRISEEDLDRTCEGLLKDALFNVLFGLALGKADLCKGCKEEFLRTFVGRIEALRKEVEEWLRGGTKEAKRE